LLFMLSVADGLTDLIRELSFILIYKS